MAGIYRIGNVVPVQGLDSGGHKFVRVVGFRPSARGRIVRLMWLDHNDFTFEVDQQELERAVGNAINSVFGA